MVALCTYRTSLQFVSFTFALSPVSLLLFVADNFFVDDYARFSTLDVKQKSTAVANSLNYMTKKGTSVQTSFVK